MTEEKRQGVCLQIVTHFKGFDRSSKHQRRLYDFLKRYPLLADKQTWNETLNLNQNEADSIHQGLDVIERNSPVLLTKAHYQLLLQARTEAKKLALLLTGKLTEKEFTQEILKGVNLFSKEWWQDVAQPITLAHYHLYKAFSTEPHRFDKSELSGVLQLNEEQGVRLLNLINKEAIGSLWQRLTTGDPEDVLVHILAERYLIVHFYHQIPQAARSHLPQARDYESSMRDNYIQLAHERIERLKNEISFDPATLVQVEVRIRAFLLDAIKAELEQEREQAGSAMNALLDKKIAFIEKYGELLATRRDVPSEVLDKALKYFSSTTSVNQTAWRAYEPTAPCIHWPNLLTDPAPNLAFERVFSTRASAQGHNNQELTQASASQEARIWSAICFLASESHPEMRQDFIYSLAEIRRAHNTFSHEIDNPSCQPGTLSRFLTATNKHPLFSQEKASPLELKAVIEQGMRRLVQSAVDNLSDSKKDKEARLMLTALHLYSQGHKQNDEVLGDKRVIDKFITATAADLKSLDSDEQHALALFLNKSQKARRELMTKLLGADGAAVYNALVEQLRAVNLPHKPAELNYLIARHLANIQELISLPKALLAAALPSNAAHNVPAADLQETQSTPLECALFKEFAAEIQNAADEGADFKARISDLCAALNNHIERLSQKSYVAKHQTVVQKKLNDSDVPREITVARVCEVLNRMYPLPVSTQSQIKDRLKSLRDEENPSSDDRFRPSH